MLILETAQGISFPISWAGVSDLDGTLRFEVIGAEMPLLFSIFTDREHTRSLTRVFDDNRKTFEGFTGFKGIERMAMIDKSMAGTDVAVVQAILTARGYYTGALDGLFSDALDAAVRKFQLDHDLIVDGVVGPMTWRKLLSLEG